MSRKRRMPKLCEHKGSGQWYVRINGNFHWLGPIAAPDSERKAEAERLKLLAEHFGEEVEIPRPKYKLIVSVLVEKYITEHAVQHYRRPDGSATSELDCIRYAVRPLVALYGATFASAFTPRMLREMRRQTASGSWKEGKRGWCVNTVNKNASRVVRIFRWAVAEELIPPEVHGALAAVAAVPSGRGYARDTEEVQPAPEESIDAVKEYLSPVLWDVVQLQLLTGARPGEVLALRPGDFDRSGPVWQVRPGQHKTRHKGKERVLLFGPKAQEVLQKYLDRPADTYLFSPAESEAGRHARQRQGRKTPVQPSQRGRGKAKRRREPGARYTARGYCHAVARACEKAKVETWAPNALRHSAASRLVQQFGWDVARIILGHSSVNMTRVYAVDDLQKAIAAVKESG